MSGMSECSHRTTCNLKDDPYITVFVHDATRAAIYNPVSNLTPPCKNHPCLRIVHASRLTGATPFTLHNNSASSLKSLNMPSHIPVIVIVLSCL